MIKRLIDIILTLQILFLLWPLMLFVILVVRLKLGSPVVFVQVRPGKKLKPFKMYKFRTMSERKDSKGILLSDEHRLSQFGFFLRATSIDELPELINVLKGEMSLVGPRPLLTEYLSLYTQEQARRHEVQPGITGWAQVNGRNALSWEDRFKLDVWYVDNHNVILDLKILLMTVRQVFSRHGVSAKGHVTMPKFKG
ncbi:MAG: sugar transferase [Desulfobulbaceae bacterium]|nr:sugar transferase [Desulfobulbaceae bacterium]